MRTRSRSGGSLLRRKLRRRLNPIASQGCRQTQKTNPCGKNSGRFPEPFYTRFCNRGLETATDNRPLFFFLQTLKPGVETSGGWILFLCPSTRWPGRANPPSSADSMAVVSPDSESATTTPAVQPLSGTTVSLRCLHANSLLHDASFLKSDCLHRVDAHGHLLTRTSGSQLPNQRWLTVLASCSCALSDSHRQCSCACSSCRRLHFPTMVEDPIPSQPNVWHLDRHLYLMTSGKPWCR